MRGKPLSNRGGVERLQTVAGMFSGAEQSLTSPIQAVAPAHDEHPDSPLNVRLPFSPLPGPSLANLEA